LYRILLLHYIKNSALFFFFLFLDELNIYKPNTPKVHCRKNWAKEPTS